MHILRRVKSIYIPLWSYSNQNQLSLSKIHSEIYIPLWSYSNELKNRGYDAELIFTFHYGPIQIVWNAGSSSSLNAFTFHYGPIQIVLNYWGFTLSYIYIPLWSYSNGIENLNIMPFKLFTFHYGPIQMNLL